MPDNSDERLPLVIDGDRLGVSLLDGNPPVAVSGPGSVDGVAYDAQGRLRCVVFPDRSRASTALRTVRRSW